MASIPNATSSSSATTYGQFEKKPATTTLRPATSHRRFWRLRRKKKLPTVTLGGQRQRQLQGAGSGSVMVRMIRRIRIRWLNLKKARVIKKLKEYYVCVLKDLKEHHECVEKHQQMLVKETSFAVPVMGISFNAFC